MGKTLINKDTLTGNTNNMFPKISIIIPTWNEEFWLPTLLNSLNKCPEVSEIIIADNNSIDRTVSIAKSYGCKVVEGGLPGVGRNNGGFIAKEEILVFIDTDVFIKPENISVLPEYFKNRNTSALHYKIKPLSLNLYIRFCYIIMDIFILFLKHFGISFGIGSFIAVKRDVFYKMGGFNKDILVGEDADFFIRLKNFGNVIYERSKNLYVSPRRFHIENPVIFVLKCMFWTVLRFSPTKSSIIKYNWGTYSKDQVIADKINLNRILK